MAFTDDEKLQIQHYLGVSEFYFGWNAEIGELGASTAAQVRVRALLSDLADVDARLKTALQRLALKKGEDGVEFAGEDELEALREHGRNLVHRLAIVFGVEIGADYYGSSVSMGGEYDVG